MTERNDDGKKSGFWLKADSLRPVRRSLYGAPWAPKNSESEEGKNKEPLPPAGGWLRGDE